MKKMFIILCFATFAVSCGKKSNNVNSATDTISGSNGLGLSTDALVNFPGEYEIVSMSSSACSATLRIENFCNGGVRVLTLGYNAPEEFCNINRGEFRTADRDPRNPGRNPPNPDRNQEIQNVTMNGNQVTSTLKISDHISFTNTMILESNGRLTKVSDLKSRKSTCVYRKL
ncbi:MAG: hypothetical protein H7177_17325 [Rhizobacter sp.]|nr:hypothetical protein [Bacteriovorax sp.]